MKEEKKKPYQNVMHGRGNDNDTSPWFANPDLQSLTIPSVTFLSDGSTSSNSPFSDIGRRISTPNVEAACLLEKLRLMSLSGEAYGDRLMYPAHCNGGRGLSFKNPVLTRYRMLLAAVTAGMWVPPEDVEGLIYYMVKHQRWCRFLQERFEGVNPDEDDMIFHGVISHVVEFMVDPYGNFLMQKVMEVCREDQWMRILRVLVKDPTNFIRICLDKHGTRAVQKLIGIVHTREQVSLIMMALKTGVLELMLDLNGSHVIRCCMETFGPQENKVASGTKMMKDLETTESYYFLRVGYADHSSIIYELVSFPSFDRLIQDPYANYVIQTALIVSKGNPHVALVEAIRPHAAVLQSNLYCKRVIQLALSTK
ncbi:hypothetical protein QJS10_CPB12g01197 [Acorus calamus]|uniref:PUM-HD domain-containing protein n=1 Tax=Acorus calamus TaxID=4465 RepID=A0AAV9DLR0_ACOCL|nr:hypothetical protein QJS10_CPB12g01197 [Acorus calamus]